MRINEDFIDNELFEYELPKEVESLLKVIQLIPNELKRLEVDYHLSFTQSIMNPLSMVFLDEIEPYSLIHQIYPTLLLNEGLITTVEANRVKNLLLGNLTDSERQKIYDSLTSPEWLQEIHNACNNAEKQLKECLPMVDEQIRIVSKGDINMMLITIPNIANNVDLIVKALGGFGYYPGTSQDVDMGTGVLWKHIQFEPKFEPLITEELKKNVLYLYHTSPTKYEHKILKNGLCPLSKNDKFFYPSRVYMIKDVPNSTTVNNSFMRGVANMLYQAKKNKREDEYVQDSKWTLYRIDVSKLQKDIVISYDPNFYPMAVFTSDNISPNALEIIDHFDL